MHSLHQYFLSGYLFIMSIGGVSITIIITFVKTKVSSPWAIVTGTHLVRWLIKEVIIYLHLSHQE